MGPLRMPFSDLASLLLGDVYIDRSPFHYGITPEPPYAYVLRRLGLFDAIDLSKCRDLRNYHSNRASSFPVVVHSAAQFNTYGNEGFNRWNHESVARDTKAILESAKDIFGETSRWAVGNLFGQLRDTMDSIESRMQDKEKAIGLTVKEESSETGSFEGALQKDMVKGLALLFPELSEEEIRQCRGYRISTHTMPNGSVETHKVLIDKDGSETTTVSKQKLPEVEGSDVGG